jgi:Pectate lyase superfamily protein
MTFIALVPAIYYNVKQYGAVGDGSTDDTAAIAAARSAANSGGGGIVFYPKGTYITGPQTLYPNVSDYGSGIGATILKLKAGSNADLFSAQTSSINLSATYNSGILGILSNFSIQNMTLDGNKANQTAGPSYPLRFYGYNFILRDVEILNGYTGGALIDWNNTLEIASPSDQMESLIDTTKIHDCNGIGLQMGGPHDSRLHNVISFNHTSHGFHFASNAMGILCTNCHGYNFPNTAGVCCYLIEGNGCQFTNCIAEGSYYCNLAIIASQVSWIGGQIFANSPMDSTVVGIQLGQIASQTPFPGQINQSAGVTTSVQSLYCMIQTMISDCQAGALYCANEDNNTIIVNISQLAGTGVKNNDISSNDTYIINVFGLTSDNTIGTSGGVNIATNGAADAFVVSDQINGQVFKVDNYGSIYLNGGLNTAAGMYFSSSTVANSLSSSDEMYVLGASCAAYAPNANVNGIIMAAGYYGQFTIIVNASAFSIQFAASGTSHVANGTAEVIPPNSMRAYFYDGTTSLWYGVSSIGEQSATTPDPGANGTITTAGVDVARVTPTASRTGVILQAGTYPCQVVKVINNSTSYTITFAAVGTSNVADGTSAVISANKQMTFVWDSVAAKWYHS